MALQPKFVFTLEEALSKLGKHAAELSRAPLTRYKVGVAGLASSRRVFFGVSVEFQGLSIYDSITAHQFLVANLALNSERGLISCPPPLGFDQRTFEENVLLCLQPQNNRLALLDPSAGDICSNPEHCSHPKCRALTAANKSYALKSECPSGVALLCEGEVYRGWYIEPLIFYPSMRPLQAALVDFVARGQGKEFNTIVEAVLVERKDAVVSHEKNARIIIDKISPGCAFNVLHCYVKPEEN